MATNFPTPGYIAAQQQVAAANPYNYGPVYLGSTTGITALTTGITVLTPPIMGGLGGQGYIVQGPVNLVPKPKPKSEFSDEEMELAEKIMEECDATRAP